MIVEGHVVRNALVFLLRSPGYETTARLLGTYLWGKGTECEADDVLKFLVARGWAKRISDSWFVLTGEGDRAAWWAGARVRVPLLTEDEKKRIDDEIGLPR